MTRHALGSSIFVRRDGSPKAGQYAGIVSDILARRYDETNVPDAFSFTDLSDQTASTQVTSSIETITGFTGAYEVLTSGGSVEININSGGWVTPGPSYTIEEGQTLQLRTTTPAGSLAETNINVSIGGRSDTWTVTNEEVVTISALTVAESEDGLDVDLTTDTANGTVYLVVLPDGATAPDASEVEAGTDGDSNPAIHAQSIAVPPTDVVFDVTVALSEATTYDVYVVQKSALGTYSSVLMDDVTTADQTPNAFSFTDETDATPDGTYTSNEVTLTGFDGSLEIEITGGINVLVNVDGGGFEALSGHTVEAGDTLQLRADADSSYSTASNIVVTVGGTSDTWTITTEAQPPMETPVVSGATDGTVGDIVVQSADTLIDTAQTDSDAGSDAIAFKDDNGGGTGEVGIQMAPTTLNAAPHTIRVRVKKNSGAHNRIRIMTGNFEANYVCEINPAAGTITADSFPTSSSISEPATDWWEVECSFDATAWTDRDGVVQIRLRESGNYNVTLDGTQNVSVHDFFLYEVS